MDQCGTAFCVVVCPSVMPSRHRRPPARYIPIAGRPKKRQRVRTVQLEEQERESTETSNVLDLDSTLSFTATQIQDLRQRLLDWYVDNYRRLPWRASPRHRKDGRALLPKQRVETQSCAGAPYAVWISEMMSQQTQISVVVEYYKRWMHKFPTVHALANASLNEVYELWAGLGYYRRARFVHQAAKQIVEAHDGVIPQDVEQLRKLCGVGLYTAGAISSIAYGNAVPLVDGNVQRVFSRLRTSMTKTLTSQSELSRAYWRLASTCVQDIENAGDFNQALMELGAMVCKPKTALCDICPVSDLCDAYKEASVAGVKAGEYVKCYPIKDKRKSTKVRKERVLALVVCDVGKGGGGRKVLMRVKEGDGLLAGLLETPNIVLSSGGGDEEHKGLEALLEEVNNGVDIDCDKRLIEVGRVTHVFSHISQSILIKVLTVERGEQLEGAKANGFGWIGEADVGTCAISAQMKKVIGSAMSKLDSLKR